MGQTQPVQAVFAVYKDAMEAQALALMGRKVRAAQTLHGDEADGAIVPVEEGDFITELVREVLRSAELEDLQSRFANEMNVSNSPMGCLTEVSPVLVPAQPRTWDEWLSQRSLSGRLPSIRRSGKRTTGQLSIWSTMKEE